VLAPNIVYAPVRISDEQRQAGLDSWSVRLRGIESETLLKSENTDKHMTDSSVAACFLPPRVALFVYRTSARSCAGLRAKQSLNGTSLVHGPVALSHLIERQCQVEDFARVDFSVQHEVDQLGQETAHWRGAAMKMNVGEEQFLTLEFDSVRNSDVAHEAAWTRGVDRPYLSNERNAKNSLTSV
jgi:hypothetical protein